MQYLALPSCPACVPTRFSCCWPTAGKSGGHVGRAVLACRKVWVCVCMALFFLHSIGSFTILAAFTSTFANLFATPADGWSGGRKTSACQCCTCIPHGHSTCQCFYLAGNRPAPLPIASLQAARTPARLLHTTSTACWKDSTALHSLTLHNITGVWHGYGDQYSTSEWKAYEVENTMPNCTTAGEHGKFTYLHWGEAYPDMVALTADDKATAGSGINGHHAGRFSSLFVHNSI
jgi:hypothetical protein